MVKFTLISKLYLQVIKDSCTVAVYRVVTDDGIIKAINHYAGSSYFVPMFQHLKNHEISDLIVYCETLAILLDNKE